ncbi:MAG: hypothetical protein Q8N18_05585 [Opitutaceae bacterium]|nr:hypothetical protein [Opitutaceae bacterium]
MNVKILGFAEQSPRGSLFEKIHRVFAFIATDFQLTEVSQLHKDENCVAIYRNQHVQLECAASEIYFHAEIRRMINGVPAPYENERDSIGFEDLAILESGHDYDHFMYFAAGATGIDGVMRNTAALFKRHPEVFLTERWIDAERLRELKAADFNKKFGKSGLVYGAGKPFIDIFDSIAAAWLRKAGLRKRNDHRQLAPYDQERVCQHIIYENARGRLKISQLDWRDDYTTYYADFDGKHLTSVDTGKYPTFEEAARALLNAIMAHVR